MAGSASFPRSARILIAADFAAINRIGRRVGTDHFIAQVRDNPEGIARVGLAVSRRVSKRAVERNRIKRQVRESFRQRRVGFPGFDVMVIARSSAASNDNSHLRSDLERLWRRIAALKPVSAVGTITR